MNMALTNLQVQFGDISNLYPGIVVVELDTPLPGCSLQGVWSKIFSFRVPAISE